MTLEYGSIPPPTIVNFEEAAQQDSHVNNKRHWQLPSRVWIAATACAGMLLFALMVSSPTDTSTNLDLLGKPSASSKKKHLKKAKKNEPKKKEFKPLYFKDQLVDHFADPKAAKSWKHRYYESDEYFAGPGHPIFVVIGGEDELTGLLYPFIYEHLAKEFKAFVFAPEHRFYGESQPVHVKKNSDFIGLHTVEQSMADTMRLIHYKRKHLKCSMDRSSKHYCPVITVGGSYPGFLSFMFRFLHPDLIDMAYASSAPLPLYTQAISTAVYYDKVSQVAEQASPGCHDAVKSTLTAFGDMVESSALSVADTAESFGICVESIPNYIQNNALLGQELLMIARESFADSNMAYYPPSEDTQLARVCSLLKSKDNTTMKKIKGFWKLLQEDEGESDHCFDLKTRLPTGANATLSTSDWSGAGGGDTARSWEFQTCYDLVIRAGFSEESMFPPRAWTNELLNEYCMSRFGLPTDPTRLVRTYGFDDIVARNASKILFTNGLNDGWSVVSITESPHPSLPVVNFPNGAHHSDLSHTGPSDKDTNDIKLGFIAIKTTLKQWLGELKE